MIRQRAPVKTYVDHAEVAAEIKRYHRAIIRKIHNPSRSYMQTQVRNLFYSLHPNKTIKETFVELDCYATVFTAVSHVHNDMQMKVEAYVGQDGITSFTNTIIKKNKPKSSSGVGAEMFMFNVPY